MLLLIPGYTHKVHGSVLLDFAAGLIRYEATVGHDVVECQVDGVGEQGTDELCTAGNFIPAKCLSCLLCVSATFYDQMCL